MSSRCGSMFERLIRSSSMLHRAVHSSSAVRCSLRPSRFVSARKADGDHGSLSMSNVQPHEFGRAEPSPHVRLKCSRVSPMQKAPSAQPAQMNRPYSARETTPSWSVSCRIAYIGQSCWVASWRANAPSTMPSTSSATVYGTHAGRKHLNPAPTISEKTRKATSQFRFGRDVCISAKCESNEWYEWSVHCFLRSGATADGHTASHAS